MNKDPYTAANEVNYKIFEDLGLSNLESSLKDREFEHHTIIDVTAALNYLRTIESSIEVLEFKYRDMLEKLLESESS